MKICSVPDCVNKHHSKGYCQKHYQQIKLYGEIKLITTHDPNEIILCENHAEIILRNKEYEEIGRALIDLEDVERCKQYKWYLNPRYVDSKKSGHLSRFLLNVTDPKILVDHKYHNTLDNRKENLRTCTCVENNRNQKVRKTGTSKYKGVYWNKNNKKWQSSIKFNYVNYYLGVFTNEDEAALAYNNKAKELFGEFACLNSIQSLF